MMKIDKGRAQDSVSMLDLIQKLKIGEAWFSISKKWGKPIHWYLQRQTVTYNYQLPIEIIETLCVVTNDMWVSSQPQECAS